MNVAENKGEKKTGFEANLPSGFVPPTDDVGRKLLKEYGMTLVVTGVSFDKLENADSLKKVIANAKDLDVHYVVCYWIPHDGDNFTFADMKKGVEVFNAAGKVLADNGIGLWYHAHGYEFRPYEGGKGTMFDYFMENTNPAYVNLQMDVFWMKNPGQDDGDTLLGHCPLTMAHWSSIASVATNRASQSMLRRASRVAGR